MPRTSQNKAPPKPQASSRIGNGKELLPGVDGRSVAMRRYKEILGQLVRDMGGDPSEAKSIIAKRSATLAVWCEQVEANLANGGNIDIGEFTTATNALRRLLTDIGLERKARDITPTLSQYLAQKHGEAA
ncbi:hypothetical protein [Mesorhizobium sp.]|uniref:hypothetical protein n=1 Tax=Mesorhizobium sp. TaxID=1871066 RepID=UPI0011F9C49F|nr:hypothetical protein [Mesorhizobium sp.]TIL43415.1 MAG: hypothetical protein E5Y86_22485 [Mesorhizobium sp.]